LVRCFLIKFSNTPSPSPGTNNEHITMHFFFFCCRLKTENLRYVCRVPLLQLYFVRVLLGRQVFRGAGIVVGVMLKSELTAAKTKPAWCLSMRPSLQWLLLQSAAETKRSAFTLYTRIQCKNNGLVSLDRKSRGSQIKNYVYEPMAVRLFVSSF